MGDVVAPCDVNPCYDILKMIRKNEYACYRICGSRCAAGGIPGGAAWRRPQRAARDGVADGLDTTPLVMRTEGWCSHARDE